MKKMFLFFVCAASFTVSKAQVAFGLKAGANFANIVGSDAEDAKMKVGFHAGGLVNIPVASMFSVQPELVFSSQGAKSEDGDITIKENLNYVNIPVLAKLTTSSGFFAETGPQLGFLMSAKVKSDGESTDIKDFFKKTDFSWALGIGYLTQSNFGVDARYNLGLSKLDEEGDAKVKNGVFQVGVFYMFGGAKK